MIILREENSPCLRVISNGVALRPIDSGLRFTLQYVTKFITRLVRAPKSTQMEL